MTGARTGRARTLLRRSSVGRGVAAPVIHRLRELFLSAQAWRADRDPGRRAEVERLAGGVPIPPPRLRARSIRNADALRFLVSGRNHQRFVADALARNGVDPEVIGPFLDFGCGCGRVLRWWPASDSAIAGTDVNAAAAGWCERNLPGVHAQTNGALPPLPYPDDSFDLIYSISIFTHLPEARQRPWTDELTRILRPGGHLLITVAGDAYRETLAGADRRRYDRGELISHFENRPGSNLCAIYHPPEWVRANLLGDLELIEAIAGDPDARMRQDAYLLKRPRGAR